MTRFFILAGISLVFALLLLSGCAKKECQKAADCGSNSKCVTYACSAESKCIKNTKPNCCGNLKCEADAGENSCTCADCGNCTKKGKVKYNITTSRGSKEVDTKYSIYSCNEAFECVVSANPELVNELKLASTVEERNYFKFELLNTLNQPFNVDTDALTIRITLTDLNPQNVAGGVSVTSVQVLNGNYLMGEKMLNRELSSVGESFVESLSLTSSQTLPEDEASIQVKVDYSYVPIDPKGNLLQTKRAFQKVSISSSKIAIIKP